METAEILRMIVGPLTGAVIGYFTNMIAVKMLFYPKTEKRLFGKRLPLTPGVIPKGRPRLARAIGEVVAAHLLTKDDVTRCLLSEKAEQGVTDAVMARLSGPVKDEITALSGADDASFQERKSAVSRAASLRIVDALRSSDASGVILAAFSDALREKFCASPLRLLVNDKTLSAVMPPAKEMLDRMIDERGVETIQPMLEDSLDKAGEQSGLSLLSQFDVDEQAVRNAIAGFYRKTVVQSVDVILQNISVSALVEEKINAMSIDELERLVQDVMKKELNAIVNLGALIGFLLGLVNLFF